MARKPEPSGRKQIDRLFEAGSLVGLTDRQLVDRFVGGEGAEAAFEALVERHGSMVRAVCRSMLGDRDEADDAFQATFLVLARRAGSIRNRDAVGSWLYGVACRVAVRARSEAARRRVLTRYLVERSRFQPVGTDPPKEPMPELLEELDRLPERYRAPIVLCYLEGRSHEQAAHARGCPLRTVQTRLQRGKSKLGHRLIRRGLAPTAGLLAIGIESAEAAPAIASGSLPMALSEATARASVQFAARRGALLATANMGLAQGVIRSLFWDRLRRAAGVAVGLAMGLALTLFALAEAGQKPDAPTTVTGRILDDRGQPIPGAEVWMPIAFDEDAATTPHATADARGRYTLTVPEAWSRLPMHRRGGGVVWAHAPGHRIGTANAHPSLVGQAKEVDLMLGPPTDTEFTVFGPDGRPVAGAVVEPMHFKTPRAYEFPPGAMLPAIRALTDADGRASLPAMPREGFFTVKVTAGPMGSQQLQLIDQDTAPARREIRLRPAGRIEGRVIAARPEWARGIKIYATTSGASDGRSPRQETQGEESVTTGPDGSFVIPAIAVGKLMIGARVDESLPVRPRLPAGLDVIVGRVNRVEIPLERAVRVLGVIRVKDSGDPVAGASISLGYGAPRQSDATVSDPDGRFAAYVPAGDVTLHVIGMPESLVQLGEPWAERHRVPEGVETFDLPPIEVVKGITIRGRLVDADDRAVADARINGVAGNRRYGFGRTDPQGGFTLSAVPPGIDLGYQVWPTEHGGPAAVEVVTKDPLRLRVGIATRPGPDAARRAGIRGQVVDGDGHPVDGVEVTIRIERDLPPDGPDRPSGYTSREIKATTDAGGTYRAPEPVQKGARYRAMVEPGRFAVASGEPVTAEHAAPITLPPLAVVRLRTIVGRVVDTDGRPVAGARVRNWGHPAPLTDATTGASGRFRIEGFPRGPAWLFVEAPGYRFHRETADPGKAMVELTIRREDQPPERGVASLRPPVSRQRAIELARTILRPAAERFLRPGCEADARSQALQVSALIRPDEAWRKCQAGEEPWNHNAVRIAMVRHLANRRPEEAEAIIPTITNDFWRQSVRIELADALPPDSRERKVALLGETMAEVLQVPGAGVGVYNFSEAARRLIDLGRGDKVRRLLDQALPRARAADAGDPRMLHTRGLIGVLARLELKAALALIPANGDERTINDLRGLVAQSIASRQPEEAERLIEQMTWNNSETYAVKASYRMAAVDRPRARRIAGRIRIDLLRGYALGRVAEVVASTGPAEARALRAEAFRAFDQAMERGMGGVWGARSAAIMAAALLPGIERTDPDRLAEALDRVLALRWFPRTVRDLTMTRPDTSGVEALRADATLAALLARYDHDLARAIAQPVVDRLKRPLSRLESSYLDRYAVLPALALADPPAAAELADVIPDLREEGLGQSRDMARLIVAQALATPESGAWAIIRRASTDLEIVERED